MAAKKNPITGVKPPVTKKVKVLQLTIKYEVDLQEAIADHLEEVLEPLRGLGTAEVIDTNLIEREDS